LELEDDRSCAFLCINVSLREVREGDEAYVSESEKSTTATVLCRVPLETYELLQLAQPFVQRRSMQDLALSIIEAFLKDLRRRNAGFEKAVVGLRESRAQEEGKLARRHATRQPESGRS